MCYSAQINADYKKYAKMFGAVMSISRKISDPVGIVNASGQPEIVIELEGGNG